MPHPRKPSKRVTAPGASCGVADKGTVVGLLISLIGLGCSSPPRQGEDLGVQQEQLSPTAVRTLGFESLSDWSALWSSPALALSALHTEGSSSLELRGGGWMLVQSRQVTREGEAPNVVGYDVRIPPSPANPWWHGSTALWLDAPSVGVWGQFVGHAELTGFPLGEFRRVEFALPAPLKARLNGAYSDLRLRVVVNASPNEPAAYQLDRFTWGPGQVECVPISDGNPCTDDICVAGEPQSQARPPGSPCDTNDTVCDGAGTCSSAAQCEIGPAAIVDDGNPCTSDACDPIGGVQHLPAAVGVSCDSDTDVCNGISRCDGAGACQPSAPPAVDDGNRCTVDACDSQLGVTHVPVPQGTSCDDDADVCNGGATCDASGACQAQPAPSIDDGNPCTTDACDPQTGVTHESRPNGTACSDGNACTSSDVCQAGVCVPGALTACPPLDECHETGTCDPSAGTCSAVAKPNGTSCSDGNACTVGDACQNGSCLAGPPKVCPALDECHDVGACDPASGACSSPPKPDGASCDDATVCNGRESCAAGVCVASAPLTVDDGNSCTADACDASGGVAHTPVAAGSSCGDGDVCNGDETCDGAGACVAGVQPSLSDGNPCTIDSCDPIAGVSHTPATAGSSCSDADACNGDEQCNAAGSCIQGPPLAVDDGDVCTEDECDPVDGVSHTPIAGCGRVHGPGAAFETRASILGRLLRVDDTIVSAFALSVFNDRLDNPAREDVWVEIESDGRFRARLSDFPESTPEGTAPQHVLVRIEGDFPTIVRSLYLRPGDAAPLGDVRVLDRDPKVTIVGPAGGIATNSADTMELVVPPGALASPTPIVITPIPTRDLFPTPLPGTTLTTYGVELEPSGTTFAAPATLRIKNTLNLPTTMKIPAGSVDPVHGDWRHEGFAVWDGTRFAAQIQHFSPQDFNPGNIGELVAIVEDGIDPHKAKSTTCVGSSVGTANGALKQDFALPSYSSSGRDYFVQFLYDSSLSGSVSAGTAAESTVGGASPPLRVTLGGPKVRFACVPPGSGGGGGDCGSSGRPTCTVGGVAIPTQVNRKLFGLGATVSSAEELPGSAEDASLVSIDVPLDENGQPTRSAYHPFSASTALATGGGSCAAGGMGFGVAAPGPAPEAGFATGSVARTELEQGSLFDFPSHQLVVHRRGSPYGSGWSVAQHRNLYRAPDRASAELLHASGERESFRPYPLVRLLGSAISGGAGAMAVDPSTGEVFTARHAGPAGIHQLDLSAGTLSPIATSPTFAGVDCYDLKVARVSGARRFLVATTRAIWEVDETGAERQLYALASGATHQPAVASVGRFAYFTEDRVSAPNAPPFYADARVIRRIDLTDPARTVESISAAEPGDLRLDPRGEALAKDFLFLHPRGLAASARGGLYVADDRRHAVYELLPDPNGDISPDSPVVRVLGSGSDTAITGLGRRLPALEMPVRSPGSLSVAPDGTLFVTTSTSLANLGGMLAYHPGEKTAGWLAFDRSSAVRNVEIPLRDGSLAPVDATTVITTYAGTFLRLTTALTSQYQPTRVLSFTETGASVLDTEADRIEEYSWNSDAKTEANLVGERLRSGEPIYSVTYRDRDRIEAVVDPSGGRTVFTYDSRGLLESIADPAGRVTRLSIDDDGNLREVIEPTSEARRFDYQDYRLTSTTYPSGEVSTYEYHEDGTLKKATKPGGAVTQLESALAAGPRYAADGRLLLASTMVDERGVTHRLEMNPEGAVIADNFEADGVAYTVRNVPAVTLEGIHSFESVPNRLQRFAATTINGVQVGPTLVWDPSGRLVKQVVPGLQGASDTTIAADTYDLNGRISKTAFNASNLEWRYGYDTSGHLTEAFDFYPYGPTVSRRSTVSGFRADGQATQVTSPRGLTSTFGFDSNGRLELLSDTVGRTLRVEYDAAGNPTLTDDATAIELKSYDAANRLTTVTDADGNVTTFGYADPGCACSHAGRLTSLVTPDLAPGASWSFDYDDAGRLLSTTHPDGTSTNAEWSTTGDLLAARDQAGRFTRFTHDHLGRVQTVTDPAGRVGRFAYTVPVAGSLAGPTLYAQSASSAAAPIDLTASLRDGDYQLGVNALQPASHRDHVSFYRDATFELGHWLEFDPNGRLTSRTDRTGRPLAATTPGPSSGNFAGTGVAPYFDELYSYDPNSPLGVVRGLETSDKYQASRYHAAQIGRDANFDITSLTHLGSTPGNAPLRVLSQDFVLDAASRVTSTNYTLVGGVEEEYEDPAFTPPWRYRLVGTTASLGTTYAATGRVQETHNERFGETFSYDARGYLQTRTLRYRELDSPASDLFEGTFHYSYDAVGRNTLLVYPEGHERRQSFDTAGRLSSRCYAYTDGTAERCYTATYDAVGNPKILTDPEMRQEIEYDTLDRVTEVRRYVPASASTPAHVERYAYNTLGGFALFDGEPVDHQRPRLDGNGSASAGMRATLNGDPIPLDGGGRVTALGNRTFRYFGIEHRLQAIARFGSETRFSYDALGRPSGTGTFSSSPTSRDFASGYLYNAYSPNIALTVSDSRTQDRDFDNNGLYHQINGGSLGWIYDGLDHPLWMIGSHQAHYYELDIIGNVRRLHLQRVFFHFSSTDPVDFGGYAYTAFGRTLSPDEPGGSAGPTSRFPLSNPYQWQARWTIGDGTLYDFRARIWSTELGAFLQPDEYQFLSHGGTLWSWPGQNPFRWRDPSGRIGFDGASTDRAIGANQDWGNQGFRQGMGGAGIVSGIGAALALGGGGAVSPSLLATGILTKLTSSSTWLLRMLGLAGAASSQAVKGCADDEAGFPTLGGLRSVGAAAAESSFVRVAGTRGLEHSFSRHAAQWFGREVPASTHMQEWQSVIERAAMSSQRVAWSTGADETVGHLARIDGKYFFAQFYQGGPRAGELATAFVPNQVQLSEILRALQ